MDVLGLLDLGSRIARGRMRRAIALVLVLLVVGWSQRWPMAHPLVQGVLDRRVEHLTELFTPDR